MVRGETPDFMTPTLFGSCLCTLEKEGGDVRPIAVGSTYRRLAVKTALRSLTRGLGDQLGPVQLGFGTQGGWEAAVHATREYYDVLPSDNVILKLDVKNAFNSVYRKHFLNIIKDRTPTLYPILRSSYLSPTPLFYGEHEIWSESGIQLDP